MNTNLVEDVLDALRDELISHPIAEPNCESPIEDIFLPEFVKVANNDACVRRQYEVETKVGRFRLDFVVECLALGLTIGVECDGRDFHSADRD